MNTTITDNASLILFPNARKAGTLYAYKPDGTVIPFIVDRNSKSSEIDSSKYIRFVNANVPTFTWINGKPTIQLQRQSTNKILYPFAAENSYSSKVGLSVELDPSTAGSELVTNGGFATDTDWTKSAQCTISDGTGNIISTDGSYQTLSQQLSVTVGKSYKLEFDITASDSGYIKVSDGSITFSAYVKDVGHYVFYYYATNTSIVFARGSGVTNVSIDNVSIKEVQGFASPFKDTAGNVLLKARKLVEDTSTGLHVFYKTFASIAGVEYTASFIVKYDSIEEIQLLTEAYSDSSVIFNIKNGTVISVDSKITDYGIIPLADGYYLVYASKIMEGDGFGKAHIYLMKNGASSYTGDGTSSIYVAGEQFEEGRRTSLINNPEDLEGSEVTRLAELDYNNFTGDGSHGGLYIEFASPVELPPTSRYFGVSGTGRINLYFVGGLINAIKLYVSNSVVSKSLTKAVVSIKDFNKAFVKWDESGKFTFFVNGQLVGSFEDVPITSGQFDYFSFSLGISTAYTFNGTVRNAMFIQEILTDEQAIKLTKP